MNISLDTSLYIGFINFTIFKVDCVILGSKNYMFVKGIRIESQFLFFFAEKSIPYAKITVSQKNCVSKINFKYLQVFYFHTYKNVTNTH